MSEKIDLEDLAWAARVLDDGDVFVRNHEILALVRAVRAAMKFSNSGHVADRLALQAALEGIVDSAEVRSDGT